MLTALKHHRSHAGTSFTKASMRFCCGAMRTVSISNWNKTTVLGFQA
jgi:hypothetical protein